MKEYNEIDVYTAKQNAEVLTPRMIDGSNHLHEHELQEIVQPNILNSKEAKKLLTPRKDITIVTKHEQSLEVEFHGELYHIPRANVVIRSGKIAKMT